MRRSIVCLVAHVLAAAAFCVGRVSAQGELFADSVPTEVAPGVFVFNWGDARMEYLGNSTVVIGTKAVMVVDAPNVEFAGQHVRWLRKHTNLPVKYLVNTHWHSDHTDGNQVWAAAFPGMEIVASSTTQRLGSVEEPRAIANEIAVDSTFRAATRLQIDSEAATGKSSDGKPVTSKDIQAARDALTAADRRGVFIHQTRYTRATTTFDGQFTLDLGDKPVTLREYGGHTLSDVVVLLPTQGLLVAGDLVITPVPYGINSHFREWVATLRKLEALDGVTVIVPGHGAILRSWNFVRTERGLIESLLTQVDSAVHSGLALPTDLDAVVKRVDLSAFLGQLTGGNDPDHAWQQAFDVVFVKPGIARAFDEVRVAWY